MFGSRHQYLFDKASDPADGGGGGDPAKPFTDDQLAVIGQTVNAAITSHMKRQPALAEQLKGLDWKALLSPVVGEMLPRLDDGGQGGGEPGGKGGKAKGGDDPVARQLKELADKLEASEKRAQAAEQARIDAENQRSFDRATAELRNGLSQKVRPELLDFLVRDLSVGQKALKLGENGTPLLTVKRAPYKGAPEEDADLPLSEALPILLASEQAKVFLPPTNGSPPPTNGGRGPRVPAGGGNSNDLPTDPAQRTLKMLEAAGLSPDELFD